MRADERNISRDVPAPGEKSTADCRHDGCTGSTCRVDAAADAVAKIGSRLDSLEARADAPNISAQQIDYKMFPASKPVKMWQPMLNGKAVGHPTKREKDALETARIAAVNEGLRGLDR